MFCQNCGSQIEPNDRVCSKCGAEVRVVEPSPSKDSISNSNSTTQNVKSELFKTKKLCCPRCKSHNLQIVSNTEFSAKTQGGGFSAGKGCCGYLALGPLGLLCGACGSKSKTTVTSTSTNVWVCRDCGSRFRDMEEIKNEISEVTKRKKLILPIAVGLPAFIILYSMITVFKHSSDFGLEFIFSTPVLFFPIIILPIAGFVGSKFLNSRISALYEELRDIEKNAYTEE